MSIATERLTAADRRAIAESLLTDPKPFKSEDIGAHCPFHVESTPGGAFFYNFEKDLAYCHSCGEHSDLVGVYNAVHGRDASDSEGCRLFVQTYCPDDGGRPIPRRPEQGSRERRGWSPGGINLPPALWQKKAGEFVKHAVDRLQSSPERLSELAAYGIGAETAKRCLFGWNDKDKWPPVTSWGLPHEDNGRGKEKKIWLPEGLVMPALRDGHVVKLKIRRTNPVTPWGENRKYWEVKGGANSLFHVYGRATYKAWVLVETERDAALVWSRCHGLGVGGIGCGGAAKRPCSFVADLLRKAPVVLNALDYDPAGATNTYKFWEDEFPNSIRYPAPPSMGKDVGDAFQAGLDVRQWVLDGLPGYVKRGMKPAHHIPAASEESAPEQGEPEAAPKPPADKRSLLLRVMDQLGPQWREELQAFVAATGPARFKIYKEPEHWGGRAYLAPEGCDWAGLNEDWERYWLFGDLRSKFLEEQDLDGRKTSLQEIFEQHFGEHLEVG